MTIDRAATTARPGTPVCSPATTTGAADQATEALVGLARAAGRRPAWLAHELARRITALPGSGAVAHDLRAICALTTARHPAGAAVVRALLATGPAGHQVLAGIRRFRSTERLHALGSPTAPEPWLERLAALTSGTTGPPLDGLKRRCHKLLTDVVRGHELTAADRNDLVALLTLEAEARTARLSAVASRVVDRDADGASARLLRIAYLDAGGDDLRDLIRRIADGEGRAAIIAPHNRFARALGSRGRQLVSEALEYGGELDLLAAVWREITAAPPRVPDPESAFARLWELSALPGTETIIRRKPDPLALAAVIVARGKGGRVVLPLPAGADARLDRADLRLPAGVACEGDQLVVVCDDAYRGGSAVPLPATAFVTSEDENEEEAEDNGNAALRRRVLSSLHSIAVTLAHLRDPKVYAVPGLVEEVVHRTRSVEVAETIATRRPLHRGFANRGVPLALLRSPLNISVKVLRKFVHVQYVSKQELRRLVSDRTGIRREVGLEVKQYLRTLA